MPAQISQARGDINKVSLEDLENGQLFWAYKNNIAASSNGHSWSEGQLYIKQGGSLIKITTTRSNNSLKLVGIITEAFDGDFINAQEDSLYRRCQEGDVFLFETVSKSNNWKYQFKKGDFLVITKAIYEKDESNTYYGSNLKEVDYIRVPSSFFDKEGSDLGSTDVSDAIKELEIRLNYKGEIFSNDEMDTAEKKKGNLYLLKSPLIFTQDQVTLAANNGRNYLGNYVKGRSGDFIFWNGANWTLIPTGLVAADVPFTPNKDSIDSVATFEEFHKNLLKNATNLQEAIELLNLHKAPLNQYGKIPFSVLPESVTTGLSFQSKFYPITNVSKDPNDPKNQNEFPVPIDENGNELESWMSGWFYIVDCEGYKNVQYLDTITNKIIELNTGDWIVWNGKEGHNHFEVIDNSDRITSVEVTTSSGEKAILLGNIGFRSENEDIKLTVDEDTIVLDLAGDTAFLGERGKVNHLSKFGSEKELVNTEVIEKDGRLYVGDDTIIGSKDASKNLEVFGDARIGWSTGSSTSDYVNHVLEFSSILADGEIERSTKLSASLEGEDTDVTVVLPDTDSFLIYKHKVDKLESSYLTKVNGDNSITDSFVKETTGDVNIGQGQTTSEKLRSATLSFYGKSNDEYPGGFYDTIREINDPKSDLKSSIEKFLQENSTHTDLTINPYVLQQGKNTEVVMPRVSGTLITFHEILNLMGDRVGEDLMLPSWRLDYNSNGEIVLGLGRSPVRTRVNEVHSGLGTQDRSNDLNKDYGEGRLKTTWSYKLSDKTGSTQEGRPEFEKNDLLTFDAWVDVQRSVASKEAFILPSTAVRDTSRFADPRNPDFEIKDPAGTEIDYTKSGKAPHSRFVPSKTVFKDDAAYFDVFGKEVPQEVSKTFELPAESGVLATHNSLMRAPTYR